jgi:hypothetical protein
MLIVVFEDLSAIHPVNAGNNTVLSCGVFLEERISVMTTPFFHKVICLFCCQAEQHY